MKTTTLLLILFLTGLDLLAQMPPRAFQTRPRGMANSPTPLPTAPTLSAPSAAAAPSGHSSTPFPTPMLPTQSPSGSVLPVGNPSPKEVPGYTFQYDGVDVNQVLDVYAGLVGRTLIRGNIPAASIILKTQSPLTKSEAIEALQAVLAVNNIAVIPIGDKFAKVLPTDQAGTAGGEFNYMKASNLPDMGSFVTHIVQLHYVKPSLMLPILQPLAKVNSIIPIDDNGILVIRDYAENVKRMLEMIKQIDVSTPLEYTNEVIPIKYAMADDIANVLNSLGGQGSSTVAFGSSGAPSTVNGMSGSRGGGMGGGFGGTSSMGGNSSFNNGNSSFNNGGSTFNNQSRIGTQGSTTPNTFQGRLNAIINAASKGGQNGQDQIQVFGEAKIIADERANSLLVFATRADMASIKEVISKLDVLLSQVLIESAIIDYSLGPNTLNFGISAAQNPQGYSSNPKIVGAGGMNNGQTLLGLLNGITGGTNASSPSIASSLPGGLSYFGNIGPHWDVALQAAASDSHATIVQRPSIMTSQAKPAQFFVGNTVPYVNGTTYGGAYGNQSSYSQLSVGVELDVTPFINPDGLVVMDIQQEIDALNGSTAIEGVGDIPNTIKRTLSSEVAVHNRDTIMLGGFIENNKSTARSGIPLLMDIPLLGNLFTSRNDQKQREELVVLMRPTVLKTPQIAAEQAVKEQQRLPGVIEAEEEDADEQAKGIAAQRKRDWQRDHDGQKDSQFFTPATPVPVSATNDPASTESSE